jgi:alkaline phosphatase
MATGLVATSDITHATPAAFGAHVHHRKCEAQIFSQLIDNGIDVLLGGGVAANRGPCLLEHTDREFTARQIDRAQSNGYTVVKDKGALEKAVNAEKLLGLFSDGGLTPVFKREASSREPTLAEMTRCALDILEKEEKGFFLMIEGSQIDWANHARDVSYLIGEMIDFDNAVKAVRQWIGRKPELRGSNTLLIVVADHETGGVILEGPYGQLPSAADDSAVQVTFASNASNPDESANHTAVDTLIWSNQPQCAGAMENTDLYYIMKDFLEIKQDAAACRPGAMEKSPGRR